MLITGTSRGIGKYLVHYYAQAGYKVVGCSRTPVDYALENYEHYCLDVSDEPEAKRLFSDIRSRYGRLDALINNAGVASQGLSMATDSETVREVFNSNFVGTFLFCREASKLMKRDSFGRIVNLSSVHVPLATIGTSVYGASKAAIQQFSMVLAREVAPFGITVNTLGLSFVGGSGMAERLDEKTVSDTLEHTILKTKLTMADVTHALDFLLAEKSGMVTNQVIYLGGI